MNADVSDSTNPRATDAWQAAREKYREHLPPDELEMTLLVRFGELRASAVAVRDTPERELTSARGRWFDGWSWASWAGRPALIGGVVTCALLASISALWWQLGGTPDVATTPFMLVSEPNGKAINVAQLVRVNVSREAMLDFGIPVPPQELQEPVRAEMLLGQRGELLAVRFVEKPQRRRFFD